jgi:uncharacterized protein YciW
MTMLKKPLSPWWHRIDWVFAIAAMFVFSQLAVTVLRHPDTLTRVDRCALALACFIAGVNGLVNAMRAHTKYLDRVEEEWQ